MREIVFDYLEVLNATEQLMVFLTVFNNQTYGTTLTLNTALPPRLQDAKIAEAVEALIDMNRKDAKEAIPIEHA